MKVIPLGTNGFFSTFNRQTACYAIPFDKTLVILDAGSGLFRLGESEGGKLLAGVTQIHLFLSHYHLDHTFGFYAAFKLLEGKKVTVFAPDKRQVFSEFIQLGHFPINYSQKHKNFIWEVLKEGSQKISFYQISVREQNHRGEVSLGFRFKFKERDLAYITDTEISKDGIEFIRGTDLLLHEHGLSGREILGKRLEDQIINGHVTTIGAARVAKEANVGKLVLIHHNPFADNNILEKQLKIARSISPDTILAKDLKEINF